MTQTPEELKIRDIFFEALKGIAPDLQPENVQVHEETFEPDPIPNEFDSFQLALKFGIISDCSASKSVVTNIELVDFELPFPSAQTLHEIGIDLTGVHFSYNMKYFGFHASSKAFLELMDPDAFYKQVKEKIPTLDV